jgi:hypothetical protein
LIWSFLLVYSRIPYVYTKKIRKSFHDEYPRFDELLPLSTEVGPTFSRTMEEGEVLEVLGGSNRDSQMESTTSKRVISDTTEPFLLDKHAWDDQILIKTWDRAIKYYEKMAQEAVIEGENMDEQLMKYMSSAVPPSSGVRTRRESTEEASADSEYIEQV